jgi:hypothetical protein
MRNNVIKTLAATGLAGALAVASATPSQARWLPGAVAAGVGIGVLSGVAIANSGYYGYPGYYGYAPGYAYAYGAPAYAYAPGYDYAYVAPAYDPYGPYVYRGGPRW